MKLRPLILIAFLFFVVLGKSGFADEKNNGIPGEFSGEISLENQYFPEEGQYGNTDKSGITLILKPEYAYSWDEDRKVVTVIPYARIGDPDKEKTQMDIRELSFIGAWDFWEIRLGVSKVFWGVTESQHLVDVVNQSDLVANIDGEDKLGQPMINPTFITDYGNLDLFFLPYFRERTFPGQNGRFRGPLLVDNDSPLYEDDDKEAHIDYAGRYSKQLGDMDVGLSYFRGTDRDPQFVPTANKLRPYYVQTSQVGLDLQYIYNSWIFKFEGIRKDSSFREPYIATTAGFEYTFSNLYQGIDVGVLVEHLYDERGRNSLAAFSNNTFLGSRLAFNDDKSSELLVGGVVDNDHGDLNSLRIEGSRRINENWRWELEGNAFINTKTDQIFNQLKNDDYVQLTFSFFF